MGVGRLEEEKGSWQGRGRKGGGGTKETRLEGERTAWERPLYPVRFPGDPAIKLSLEEQNYPHELECVCVCVCVLTKRPPGALKDP